MKNKNDLGKITQKVIEFIKTERINLIPLYIFCRKFADVLTEDEVIEYLAEYYIIKPFLKQFFNESVINNNQLTQDTERFIHVLSLQDSIADEDRDFIANYEIKEEKILFFESYLGLVNKAKHDKNGVVFTPTEIIDFLIKSCEHIMKTEFNSSLDSDDVAICDPFTGIAPFITSLSNYVSKEHFLNNVCCNELMLFSYYIATLNIENTYFEKYGEYRQFANISLSDTFGVYENENENKGLKEKFNNVRLTEKNNSPRGGIIAFITNGSFIDAKALSGFRISLEQEFDKIYIVNLRGNSRTRGDLNKREGENIFKNGCRTTVVLTILVKRF